MHQNVGKYKWPIDQKFHLHYNLPGIDAKVQNYIQTEFSNIMLKLTKID